MNTTDVKEPANLDKRIQARLIRERGMSCEKELESARQSLADLSDRIKEPDEAGAETFAQDLSKEMQLRAQRIGRQLQSAGSEAPQAELLPGDTRD